MRPEIHLCRAKWSLSDHFARHNGISACREVRTPTGGAIDGAVAEFYAGLDPG